jgi:hypothetical protein
VPGWSSLHPHGWIGRQRVLKALLSATIGVAALGMVGGMCKNPQVDTDRPAVAGVMAAAAAAVARRAAAVHEDVYRDLGEPVRSAHHQQPAPDRGPAAVAAEAQA